MSISLLSSWLLALAPTAAVLLAGFSLAWLITLPLRNVGWIDVLWGPSFAVASWSYRLADGGASGSAQLLGLGLVTLWGGRLGLHLAARAQGKDEDRRYAAMRDRDPAFAWTSLPKVFWLQALLALVISAPLLALQTAPPLGALHPLVLLGSAVALLGILLETVADEQLRQFRADAERQGDVLDTGLWRYSRHPNYFGDFCVWWGFWILCLPAPGGFWTFPAPLLMSVLLLKVSGVSLLESDIGERRPAYREYVRRTNAFFPGPPRRETP